VQLRRVLLLFALVLGLSAVVASIVPPPETREERDREPAGPAEPTRRPAAGPSGTLAFAVPADAREDRPRTRRAAAGSRLSVQVSVPEPGEVTLEGLGLRASADPRAPARFDLVARPNGRYAVVFVPLRGGARVVGRLEFADAATVRPRAPAS
jgi:hypothetical protein